ncbi:MAG: hypothetical protein R6X33_02850 [Candidatus Brocadiia bacterium]
MKVSVNERVVQEGAGTDGDLGDLLNRLRADGDIPDDQVVVGLRVDERQFSADDLTELAETPLRQIGEVAVATDDVQGYAARILADVVSMLRVLRQAVPRVAESLREGDAEEANADLFRLLAALQNAFVCLHQVQNTCDLAHGPTEASEPLADEISEALDIVEAAQKTEDWDTLADALQGRLLPTLNRLGEVVELMRNEF